HRGVQMLPAACLATLFSMTLSFAVPSFSHATPFSASGQDILVLACFGAFQLAGGMLLFTYGVRLVPAAESALLSIIETVAAPVWVYLVFAENPGSQALL